jgi:capsule polysaccharide export protein KpsE/RkpR
MHNLVDNKGNTKNNNFTNKDTREAVLDLHKQTDMHQDLLSDIGKDLTTANTNLQTIAGELDGQGQQIKRIHGNVQDTNVTVKRTDKLTNKMQTRAYCMKFLLHILAILLFIANITVLILKLVK